MKVKTPPRCLCGKFLGADGCKVCRLFRCPRCGRVTDWKDGGADNLNCSERSVLEVLRGAVPLRAGAGPEWRAALMSVKHTHRCPECCERVPCSMDCTIDRVEGRAFRGADSVCAACTRKKRTDGLSDEGLALLREFDLDPAALPWPHENDELVLSIIESAAAARASTRRPDGTVNRLHRRCQLAESAARTTLEDCKRQGVGLGRQLASWAYAAEQQEHEKTRAEMAAARDRLQRLDTAIRALPRYEYERDGMGSDAEGRYLDRDEVILALSAPERTNEP